jgi:lysophospholipase L1-like esterase
MRHARACLVIAAAAAMTACTPAATAVGSRPHVKPRVASYYLALGDSLSRGVQPNAAGVSTATRQGYPDQLYALLRIDRPGLRLVKLGCPGETTSTMINGGICHYPAGSQLAAAVSFLHAHPGRISLITIDIGANDPDSCITRPGLTKMATCIGTTVPATAANLTRIMTALREAAGGRVRIIGMNYYLPELAQWREGLAGEALAEVSERLAVGYNDLLTSVYRAFGARIANVFSAFRTPDFTGQVALAGLGRVPSNVAAVCRWTWECAPPPRGPNEHANATGYRVIAQSFLRADLSSAG